MIFMNFFTAAPDQRWGEKRVSARRFHAVHKAVGPGLPWHYLQAHFPGTGRVNHQVTAALSCGFPGGEVRRGEENMVFPVRLVSENAISGK